MSSPQKSSFKFPKAVAAVGLAAVLVGCGGGGSESARTSTEPTGNPAPRTLSLAAVPGAPSVTESFTLQPGTSKTLINGNHVVTCARGGAPCQVDVDSGNMVTYTGGDLTASTTAQGQLAIDKPGKDAADLAEAKKKQEETVNELYKDVLAKINDLGNYSAGANKRATSALEDFENELDSSNSRTYLTAAQIREYKGKVTTLEDLIARNSVSDLWLDAITEWNSDFRDDILEALHDAPASIDDASATAGEITVTANFGDTTHIKAGSYTPKENSDGPGGIWASKKFETGSDDIRLKVFTSHQGTSDVLVKTQWGTFFDRDDDVGHYDIAKTFGRGESHVKLSGGDGDTADQHVGINIAAPGLEADEARISSTTDAPVYNPVGYVFPKYARTKIHKNDVVLLDKESNPIELTKEWKRVDSGILNAVTNNKHKFFNQTGAFTCTGGGANASCALALDDDGFIKIGIIKTGSGQVTIANTTTTPDTASESSDSIINLRFLPEHTQGVLGNRTITIHRPDTTYMTMGYWMDGDGDKFTVNTFATARYWYGDVDEDGNPINEKGLTRNAEGNNNIGMVAGTARYSGDAVGVYVMNKGAQNEIDIYNGEFTADADLTADFGRRVNDNDDPFKVSGTITGFDSITRDSDDLSSWSLTLNESAVNQSSGHFSGTTTGGKWQGQFYGNAGRDTAAEDDNYPVAVVGEFSGDFGNHNEVVGVFGVEKD